MGREGMLHSAEKTVALQDGMLNKIFHQLSVGLGQNGPYAFYDYSAFLLVSPKVKTLKLSFWGFSSSLISIPDLFFSKFKMAAD